MEDDDCSDKDEAIGAIIQPSEVSWPKQKKEEANSLKKRGHVKYRYCQL